MALVTKTRTGHGYVRELSPPPAGLLWSDAATWAGRTPNHVPLAGEDVIIEDDMNVVLDVVTPSLGSIAIAGRLQAHSTLTTGLTVTKAHLEDFGKFHIGSALDPHTGQFTMTFTGPKTLPTSDPHDRGMMVHAGAELLLFTTSPYPTWTKLNATANAGATALTAKDTLVGWNSGDEIIVGPTDYYGYGDTELRSLAGAATGTSFTCSAGLTRKHFGALQYFNATGMSYTPDGSSIFLEDGSVYEGPRVLDCRAPVANLTRKVIFQSINDSAWSTDGFGFHIMIMDRTAKVVIDGAAFIRGGQRNITGRYPIHWHMNSFRQSDGAYLGDIPEGNAIIRNCVFRDSSQRAMIVHSTCGVLAQWNVAYNIQGHAYFLEDATEERNRFEYNLALRIRQTELTGGTRLMAHEGPNGAVGPTGFWITNPANDFIGNHAADCQGCGMWWTPVLGALNISTAVSIEPYRRIFGEIRDNTVHSNRGCGHSLKFNVLDNNGNIGDSLAFRPTDTGASGGAAINFLVLRMTSFKNANAGYNNRVSLPHYEEWMMASNHGHNFIGQTDETPDELLGHIKNCLIVDSSKDLNNDNPEPHASDLDYAEAVMQDVGMATYHSGVKVMGCAILGFTVAPYLIDPPSFPGVWAGGQLRLNDYYVRPVEMGTYHLRPNCLLDSDFGFWCPPPNLHPTDPPVDLGGRNFTFAGARWDPWGHQGAAGNYICYDKPFFTHGTGGVGVTAVTPTIPGIVNSVSIPSLFYGFDEHTTNFDSDPYQHWKRIRARRYNSSFVLVDTWEITEGVPFATLAHMRHWAGEKNGIFVVDWPNDGPPLYMYASVLNLYRALGSPTGLDSITVGYSMNCSVGIRCRYFQGYNWPGAGASGRECTAAASRADVIAGDGTLFYKDVANNLVWVKLTGGLAWPYGAAPVIPSYEGLYRTGGIMLDMV